MNARTNERLGVFPGLSFDEYLAVPAMSASSLKLLARSAWHYKHRQEVKPTRPMLCGTLAHCAALEPEAMGARYVVVPDDAPRRPTDKQWTAKKPSQESQDAMAWWRDFTAKAEGRQIVAASDYAVTQMQLQALAAEPTIGEILRAGQGEVSVFWRDERTGVYCKARPDWMTPANGGRLTVMDLKTTADESPSGFGRAAARLKYHLQWAHYVAGIEQVTGLKVEEFVFAAVTSAPPVLAVPYFLTDDIKAQAQEERNELLDLYARCLKSDTWPAYGQGLQMLDFPAYAKREGEVEVSFAE